MARKRMIDPAFFLDEEVASLSPHARLLYIGSWTLADDVHFTLPKRPDWIKAQIFPYETAVNVAKLIEDLIGIGKYIPFSNGDKKEYLFIPTMAKHQTINRPSAPKYPAHPDAAKYITDDSRSTHSKYNIREDNISKSKYAFEDVWSKYPKRLGRKDAERHFNASVKTDKDWEDINKAVENFNHSKIATGDPQFIPHGSTWFNNWRDWIDKAPDPLERYIVYGRKR